MDPTPRVVALQAAGAAARGATAYVTLEPCTHQGRTPPCTDALTQAGVARVVMGMRDPNETVAGGGAELLRSRGVDVSFAEDPTPFLIQNEAWLAALWSGRPFVRAKVALSLDGRPALEPGRRASITGVHGATVTRRLRARADAVLVGGATVTADDPALTVRDSEEGLGARQPVRVVLVRESMPPADSAVFDDGRARTILLAPKPLATMAARSYPRSLEVATYEPDEGLLGALRALIEAGIVDLLVEPGPRLFTALWQDGLIDELIVVHAGGVAGPSAPALFLGDGPDDADASE